MRKVLVLEENTEDIKCIEREFERLEFPVEMKIANDGKDGLDLLTGNIAGGRRLMPDIILVNMNLPGISGFELLRIIKNYYSLKPIKIFLLAKKFEEYDRIIARHLGAEGIIKKPFDSNTADEDFLKLLFELKPVDNRV